MLAASKKTLCVCAIAAWRRKKKKEAAAAAGARPRGGRPRAPGALSPALPTPMLRLFFFPASQKMRLCCWCAIKLITKGWVILLAEEESAGSKQKEGNDSAAATVGSARGIWAPLPPRQITCCPPPPPRGPCRAGPCTPCSGTGPNCPTGAAASGSSGSACARRRAPLRGASVMPRRALPRRPLAPPRLYCRRQFAVHKDVGHL